jgi:hypothetical protein
MLQLWPSSGLMALGQSGIGEDWEHEVKAPALRWEDNIAIGDHLEMRGNGSSKHYIILYIAHRLRYVSLTYA